eukprot:TRINITY_DN3176_c0_g1_i1.p1 TRINITY_DN3176_c0_g1~~TRINITY_DN3176_c0_g1_i1.p1  ORF type:complete len:306 (-),score=-9.93 TRINITY_DN3176_c0_g1_i1:109-1026(-)
MKNWLKIYICFITKVTPTTTQMVTKFILTLCTIIVVIKTTTAVEKAQRIADTIQASILTPPFFTQYITLNITQDATIYLLPGESTSVDFKTAYSFEGPDRQWIWIFNGKAEPPTSEPLWQGTLPNYNPLQYPKATMLLILKNSAGGTITPVITVTLLVSPRITTALPESMTVTEGEEVEVSVDIIAAQRSVITWEIDNKALPYHTPTLKFIPTMDMDGKILSVHALNPMGVATSTTTLRVKMAPWKIALIVVFAVGGPAAGAFLFLKKKGYFNNKVEYINASPNPKGDDDDNRLVEDETIEHSEI